MNKENLKNNRAVRRLYYFAKSFLSRKQILQKAGKTISDFGFAFDEKKAKQISKDMLREFRYHGLNPDEYLCYRFHEKGKAQRRAFVADWEHLGYTCALNNPANAEVFDNKWKTYECYRDYYKRTMVLCTGEESYGAFEAFVNENDKMIVKPMDASCGNGVRIFDFDKDSTTPDAFFRELLAMYDGRFVVEQLIVQSQEMAAFHPASVNTVRVPTIRLDDETLIIHPFMRMGQHGKNVDNAGAGGIMGVVDVETGRIYATGDEYAQSYDVHPDSNLKILDFVIPRWDEAKALVKELATVLPDNRYTGWDLALTDDGWVLVEANRRGQFVWQIPMQIGFRKEIDGILKRLGKKY